MAEMFDTITVIGLGLIGSSLVHDIRTHRLAKTVIGIDPDSSAGERMRDHQLLDTYFPSIEYCVDKADLVIVATPPRTFAGLSPELPRLMKEHGLLIDTGSVKQHAIVTLAANLSPQATFIPCHPIAGSEKSGAGSGKSGLFLHRRIILTPYREDKPEETAAVIRFWESMGGQCEGMDAALHDHIYAYMSHLPQVTAFAVALTLVQHTSSLPATLAPFLRIAGSSPALWVDILQHNRSAVLEAIEHFVFVLGHIVTELTSGAPEDTEAITDPDAATELLPRVIASCLISTVALTERKEDEKFARYAGQGFRDMTDVVQTSPETDIERISNAYGQVATLLDGFERTLREWIGFMRTDQWDALQGRFGDANAALEQLKQKKH